MADRQKPGSGQREPFWWAAEINSMIKSRRYDKAFKALDALMDKNLDRNYALLYRVRLLQKMGRVKEAIAWVCLENELYPEDPKIVALKDEMMELYPYSLFQKRPSTDILSNFRQVNDEWPGVAGMQEIKIQLHNDLILPIIHREKFQRFGVDMPNGILFYGPPGCGKTYIARRLADKIEYGFYELKLSHIGSAYIHKTATRIGDMFKHAAENSPMLLFLDEVDSLGGDRNSAGAAAHNLEEVNELLKQMDRCHEKGILVIGACNAIERVDPALRRPGRFDKQVFIGPPDDAARDDLFRHFLKERPVAGDINYEDLVNRTSGYSNADIEAVVNQAARNAAIQDAPKINKRHMKEALDVIPSSIDTQDKQRQKQIGFSGTDQK